MLDRKNKAIIVIQRLEQHYSINKKDFLQNYSNPFQLLIATILSAQSTDKQVNNVTEKLFKKFQEPSDFLSSSVEEIEEYISGVGLYKTKARYLYNTAKILVEKYNSTVPTEINELVTLPGVGRKTANVILNDWYNKNNGIAVDTHVKRITYRLGLTKHLQPNKIEKDLKSLFPRNKWGKVTKLFILHGRNICRAKKAKCDLCFLSDICNKTDVVDLV